MNSVIYRGYVSHARVSPVRHAFRFPFFFCGLDLDELDTLDRDNFFFGHNRVRLLSLHDRDYMRGERRPLREALLARLEEVTDVSRVDRCLLLTSPRFLNYVFNPVSFFLCFDAAGTLLAALAEVNNTFGERHQYRVTRLSRKGAGWESEGVQEKVFHVSPFNDMRGEYRFYFQADSETAVVRVDLYRDGQPWVLAAVEGKAVPFCKAGLLGTILRYPATTFLTMPRIMIQAAKLYWQRKLPVFTKPEPLHPDTVLHQPQGWMEKLGRRVFSMALGGIEDGGLKVIFPDGQVQVFGNEAGAPCLRITHRYFFRKLVTGGDVGFGEAYVEGWWETDDLAGVLLVLARNNDRIEKAEKGFAMAGKFKDRVGHLLRGNSVRNSRRNIADHYDLSNDFYRLWLDPSMMYSAAVWKDPAQSLEEAQCHKLDLLVRKAELRPEHHLLEIGTGWGGLALHAARTTGCRVTTITLSEEQAREARDRIKAAGLEDRIVVRLQDYRTLEGCFDRIISVEMIEAVGHQYLGGYFQCLDRLLAPGGIAVLQAITMPDERYEAYRRKCDWIQKHIFPGGHLPSPGIIRKAAGSTSLQACGDEEIGLHYAETLRRWRAAFEARTEELDALGFDETFRRKWRYYLAYCEAGFDARIIHTRQLVFRKP